MVYAVSLDLRVGDFRYVARHPLAVGAGLVAQFVLLPAATLGVTLLLDSPAATMAAVRPTRTSRDRPAYPTRNVNR
jgi:BASS family bile acid:Na+ symporter